MELEDDDAYVYPLTSSYCLLSVGCMQMLGPLLQSIQQSCKHVRQVLTLYACLQCWAARSSYYAHLRGATLHIPIYPDAFNTTSFLIIAAILTLTPHPHITLVLHAPWCCKLAGLNPIPCKNHTVSADCRQSVIVLTAKTSTSLAAIVISGCVQGLSGRPGLASSFQYGLLEATPPPRCWRATLQHLENRLHTAV